MMLYVLNDIDEGSTVGVFSSPHEALGRAYNGRELAAGKHRAIVERVAEEGAALFDVVIDDELEYSYGIFAFELDGWY